MQKLKFWLLFFASSGQFKTYLESKVASKKKEEKEKGGAEDSYLNPRLSGVTLFFVEGQTSEGTQTETDRGHSNLV